jgi:hypothetical protein
VIFIEQLFSREVLRNAVVAINEKENAERETRPEARSFEG